MDFWIVPPGHVQFMVVNAFEDVLFPGLAVRIRQLCVVGTVLMVDAVGCGRPGRCPDCGVRAARVHSRYWRHLSDRPAGGRQMVIRLLVRRFRCDQPLCPRRTFVEQVWGLSERRKRSTLPMRDLLRAIAVELGGRPGQRLCHKLLLAGRRSLLLGLLEAPPVPARAPRVLGVDEFAFRKGRTYGTLLVDVEGSLPVDVLPDRETATLTAWLRAHPGAEIVCRDRATSFTRAIQQAAPAAVEVADRWHLLANLSAAVEKTCHQHRDCLRKHADRHNGPRAKAPEPNIAPQTVALPRTAIVARTRQRHQDVHELLDQGWTISAIARRLRLDRKTVRRFKETDLDVLITSARDRRPGLIDPFTAYLQARFAAGCTSPMRLFREVRERGYGGSRHVVCRYVASIKDGTAVPAPAPIPSPRKITSWIMRSRETLQDKDAARLDRVRLACPDIAAACDFARVFAELVRNRRGHLLLDWIRQAEQDGPKPIRGFAGFLRQDLDAVTAGMTLAYSSGVVEGHVNRIKTIKRQMYGRASFPLLRARILIRP
ncbi:ISL3 family transposase [Streptomyces sp. NPDC050658]|uniref:ISL3 family transposase n=1 Tax=unclassified Streptomyces TaxID=2593676 RepID=UPI00341F151D